MGPLVQVVPHDRAERRDVEVSVLGEGGGAGGEVSGSSRTRV
ncbi:hypothetical protein FM112_09445 [Gulosibacter sp. 10]|nr:hypothetical protein FM112_09445 [Gulosibacter sp. 10]